MCQALGHSSASQTFTLSTLTRHVLSKWLHLGSLSGLFSGGGSKEGGHGNGVLVAFVVMCFVIFVAVGKWHFYCQTSAQIVCSSAHNFDTEEGWTIEIVHKSVFLWHTNVKPKCFHFVNIKSSLDEKTILQTLKKYQSHCWSHFKWLKCFLTFYGHQMTWMTFDIFSHLLMQMTFDISKWLLIFCDDILLILILETEIGFMCV